MTDSTTWLWLLAVALTMLLGAWLGARAERDRMYRDVLPRLRRWRRRSRDAEATAANLSQLLDQTFRVVNIGLIHIDELRRIRSANPIGRVWFDIEPDSMPTLMAVAGSAELRDVVDRALAGDGAGDYEARIAVRQQVYRVQVAPLSDGGALLAMRDDTALEHLTRAQREIVDAFSHDLRTPLASIRLLADNLLGEMGDDATTRHALTARLDEQITSLTDMADSLLDLSRLESGRVLLRLRPENLGELGGKAVQGLTPQLEENRVSIEIEVPGDVIVLADGPQVTRVFSNLLDNALSFSPADGRVRVGAQPKGDDMIEVFVSDGGPGISPADADRVFERFYRGDRARSGGGKGLGLAIARHIVVGHGGTVWVDTSLTDGATIRFTLPLARAD